MKHVFIGALLCVAFFVTWSSNADSVSLPGYSVVRLDADTGKVLWRFGDNLINPLLEIESGSLIVSAETTDHIYHSWEIAPDTGVFKRELQPHSPSSLGLPALERFSCKSCIHLKALADLWKPPLKGRSGREAGWLAANCRCVVTELDDETGRLFGVAPSDVKTIWTQDLRSRLPYRPGRTHVWPLPEGGFLTAFDPLLFRVTPKGMKWEITQGQNDVGPYVAGCMLFRLNESGEVLWQSTPKASRLKGAYSQPTEAYRLGPDVLIRCSDQILRVALGSGRVMWEFDAGPSAQVHPVGDETRLFLVQRQAPKCHSESDAPELCPW